MAARTSVVDRKMKKKHEDEYKRRLKNVKSTLDLSPPREFMHLQLEVKRLQVEQEKQAEIDRQNLVIIDKLSEIKTSPARVDAWNKDWKPSNDRLKRFRDRRQRRIDEENRLMAERLKKVESYYRSEEWEKDYEKHLYYMSMIEASTKDYDNVEDEDASDDDFESDDDDKNSLPPVPPATPSPSEGRRNKKDSDSDDNISLPPIDNKPSSAEKSKKKKTGYSEHEAIMDAEELKTAIEENDKERIMGILGRTSEKDKMNKLEDKYKDLYKKDLNEELKSVLDEEIMKALESLAEEAAMKDAKTLYEATKGFGTDEDALISILCTRPNKELAAIREAYKEKYDHTLEEDLRGDTSGDLETLLVELSKGQRDESKEADIHLAKKDAKDLMEAGVASWGTDEGAFIRVFTQRSFTQISAMCAEYKKLTKVEIEESIDKEMDGDMQKAFLTLVKISRDPTGFQGDKLKAAVKDGHLGAVAKILLPMNKAKLNEVSASYKKDTKHELADDIQKISGESDLKALLLAKLGKEQNNKQNKNQNKKAAGDKGQGQKVEKAKKQEKGRKEEKSKKEEKEKNKAGGKEAKKDKANEKDKDAKSKEEEKKAEKAAKEDADELHQAIQEGNKDAIIDILARNCDERSKLDRLKDKYKDQHDQDILEALQPHLGDDVKDPVESFFSSSSAFDAKCLHDAIKGLGTDEDLLIEIICTRKNTEINDIKEVYKKNYDTTLEDDVKGDTSGDFEDLLVKLLQATRVKSDKVDKKQVKADAESLQKAGVKSFGTDEDVFVDILTQRSHAQLNAIFAEYKKLQQTEIEDSIENEMSGDLAKGLLALVKCIRDEKGFNKTKLQKSMADGDTATAARIIFATDKATLSNLTSTYKDENKKNMEDALKESCSPHLHKLLLGKMGRLKQQSKEKEDAKNTEKDNKKAEKAKPPQKAAQEKNKKQSDAAKNKKEQEESEIHKAIKANDKKKIKELVMKAAVDKKKLKKLGDDYKKQYKQDLTDALDGKLEEDLHEAVAAMLLPGNEADARTLYFAMKGLGTKESQLIEILCTRNNTNIDSIKEEYQKKYGCSLEDDVKEETSGDFEDLLVALMSGKRDESDEINEDLAHKDAEALIEAGIKKWGTDEDCFIEIFTTRSYPQLQAMFPEYSKWAKCDIEDTISSEMDGDLKDALLVLVKAIQSPTQMTADKLHSALQNKDTLTVARMIAGADPASLSKIEKAYNENYKPKLYFEVDKKCSPDLKKILLPKLKDKTQDKETKKATDAKASGTAKPPGKKASGAAKKDKEKEKEDDITKLQKAIDKSDKKTTTAIIVSNASDEGKLKKLNDEYNKRYKKDLVEQLDGKVAIDVHEAVTSLLLPATKADVRSLYYAMKGLGTKEAQLIEILCTRSNAEIQEIKQEYNKKYGRSLTDDMKSETSGDFENLLETLLKGSRDESTDVNKELVTKDAAALVSAGVARWGTDEDQFITILSQRSSAHVQAVLAEYKTLSGGVSLADTVRDEMKGDLRDALLVLISYGQDPSQAAADKLNAALHDGDTVTVARIVAGTQQGPLADLEASYNATYNPKAYFEVEKRCSEDLKKIILNRLKDKTEDKKIKKSKDVKPASSSSKPDERKPSDSQNKEKDKEKEKVEEKDDDITKLQKAIEKSDKKTATEVIVCNASDEGKLKKLSDEYNKRYEKDLVEQLDGKVADDVHEAVTSLLLPATQADVRSLYYAMKGLGTKEAQLIETLCTRSNTEINDIKQEYSRKYGRSLTDDVKSETSGDFENLLETLLKATRDESTKIDEDLVTQDAAALVSAGVARWGTEEDQFITILTQRSSAHVQAVLAEYRTLSGGVTLADTIRDEMKGDLRDALLLLAYGPNVYQARADKLHTALHDGNTVTVARIVAGTPQDSMADLEASYNATYNPKAYFEVEKRCSEDLKKIILNRLKDRSEDEKPAKNETPLREAEDIKETSTAAQPEKNDENKDIEDDKDKEKKSRPKLDVRKIEYHGTVVAAENFDAGDCAEKLKKAMKGFGSDEEAIIEVLQSCNLEQRLAIAQSFKQQYDKDLVNELKSELSGKFEDAIVALLLPPEQLDANALHGAMQGLGTNDSVLIEILCSRSAEELQSIKKAYNTAHGKDLVAAVKSETSGDFQALLVALLDAKRVSADEIVNEDQAYEDAKNLYEAGEKKWGTDESVFTKILTCRSDLQLRALYQAYQHVAKCDILETIDDELTGDYHDAVKAIVRCTRRPPLYFAESLNSALNGLRTDSSLVTRIIISRSEVDLADIKAVYKDTYGKTLATEVKELLKGDHETLLLKILRD
ncbi:uncharacterized protein LOC5516017 isoform X2 [Nematostella vectensis]|uniref:uncharacterized protein LOC5516017 isoform X2 n=1 Tax=Nematostella vectensis TaxID=45351 RepID=UPI00207702E3|nr:uncharacterized protein LOC5516017 isoform X2 [Nematostella vectensis]